MMQVPHTLKDKFDGVQLISFVFFCFFSGRVTNDMKEKERKGKDEEKKKKRRMC